MMCRCKQKLDELDHAVIVSGYGTTEDGLDYWLMKNTWCAPWSLPAQLSASESWQPGLQDSDPLAARSVYATPVAAQLWAVMRASSWQQRWQVCGAATRLKPA